MTIERSSLSKRLRLGILFLMFLAAGVIGWGRKHGWIDGDVGSLAIAILAGFAVFVYRYRRSSK